MSTSQVLFIQYLLWREKSKFLPFPSLSLTKCTYSSSDDQLFYRTAFTRSLISLIKRTAVTQTAHYPGTMLNLYKVAQNIRVLTKKKNYLTQLFMLWLIFFQQLCVLFWVAKGIFFLLCKSYFPGFGIRSSNFGTNLWLFS